MSSITHSTIKEWKRFLTEAGLTKELAIHYADIFSHHRMRMSMLPDLNKDILFFMGIEVMGDVIAILKHAKQVSVSLGYSKDYEASKSRSSASKQHKRERTPQYHASSRNYSSSYERKQPQEFEPSPQLRRSNKPNQEFSSFQSFSRGHEKRSPEINITFSNSGWTTDIIIQTRLFIYLFVYFYSGNQKNYRGNETSDNRSSSRYEYQSQNQHYTTTPYRNRDIRSRSRSRSPVFSTRLHMDESPAKHSVRSRISSRPTKKALSPITFTAPQRTTSHASNARYYRAHTQEKKSGEFPDTVYILYRDIAGGINFTAKLSL